MPNSQAILLAITELGGYPDFTSLYNRLGYQLIKTDSVRKAVKLIRQYKPVVVVAEFNFQSDFRDRTSSLETILSSTQGISESKMIVLYEQEYRHQYERFLERFEVFASLVFPIDKAALECVLQRALLE